jgi:hypothetical protein
MPLRLPAGRPRQRRGDRFERRRQVGEGAAPRLLDRGQGFVEGEGEAEGDRHRAADAGVEEAVDLGTLAGQGHDQERRDGCLVDQHLAAPEEQRECHHQGDEDGHLDRADADQVDDRGGDPDADGDADRELDRTAARLAAGEAERDDRGGGGEERLRLADDQLCQRPGDPGGDGGLEDRLPGAGESLQAHPRRAADALLEGPVARCHRLRAYPCEGRGIATVSLHGKAAPADAHTQVTPLQPRGGLWPGRVRGSLGESDRPKKGSPRCCRS